MAVHISDDLKAKIKEHNPIVDVAAELMKVERSGDLYVARCFHPHGGTPDAPIMDKTPSLTFYPGNDSYFCFRCRLGSNDHHEEGPADQFKLVQQYFRITQGEEMSFADAARWLIDRARKKAAEDGRTIDLYLAPAAPPDPETERQKKRKTEMNRKLWENLMADEEAKQYLYDRGFTDEDFADYRVGLTPQDHPWQLARNRIAFGIVEVRTDGEQPATIGFSYRTLEGRDCEGPKYLLDSERNNLTFQRDRTLFLLNRAYRAIRQEDHVHLVEGAPDAIWMHKVGITNTVANFGTTVSDGQLDLLGKYTKNVKVWLEDDAGIVTFLQQLPKFFARGFNVDVIVTGGLDPDEICRKYGAAGINSYVKAKCRPAVMYYLNEISSAYDKALHEARKVALSHVLPIAQGIRNPAERAIFLAAAQDRFGLHLSWADYCPPPDTTQQGIRVLTRSGMERTERRITVKAG